MLKHFTVFLMLLSAIVRAQYTDQINSNRPGASIGAFAVGKGIVQFEGGLEYRRFKHEAYNNSTVNGRIGFLSIRWGFLFEQLELTYDGSYMMDRLTNKISLKEFEYERKGFLKNFIGIKYLVYDGPGTEGSEGGWSLVQPHADDYKRGLLIDYSTRPRSRLVSAAVVAEHELLVIGGS